MDWVKTVGREILGREESAFLKCLDQDCRGLWYIGAHYVMAGQNSGILGGLKRGTSKIAFVLGG